jgi:hypothetical protein
MTPQERKNFESIRDNVHGEQAQKQEPVAWCESDGKGGIDWRTEDCFSDDPVWLDNPMPLYTSPPPVTESHKRQPLTDEQVWDAYMEISAEFDCNVIDLVEFARAIEQAHGIGEQK